METFETDENDFKEVHEPDELSLAVKKAFGINYLFPWQRIVIQNILDANFIGLSDSLTEPELRDVEYRGRQIVLLPTGAGKSLCFLAPSLLLPGPTLVLYPLLALMADQKRRMDEAERLLRLKRHSIAEITALCGFRERNYFTNLFQRLHGLPPAAWREAGK